MDLKIYFLLFPQRFNRDLRINMDTKSYFLKPFKKYLRRNIDQKSSMDLKAYFLLFP